MIVPREHLKRLVGSGDKEKRNILEMITKDLSAHPDCAPVRSYADDVMGAMLGFQQITSPPVLAQILKHARMLGDNALYRRALQKAMSARPMAKKYEGTMIWPPNMIHNTDKFSNVGDADKLLPTVAEICNNISSPRKSDWDDWQVPYPGLFR